ncbi:glycosyltransferase [Roseivirga misakiensis]|uniref:Glycosyltransferase 2-like domain-containing protein n=1 Tax=Roseivirga misakiensis TaxID=1563681 RepID=A0A1E5SL76_9BACT|nr:glycosyltransferase [Roseivirga misakiensis]OEJ99877.1 hypothetical protein BFP71_10030 [Roseivirga misakiensis]
MNPLVTIICISYNHAPYIKEALDAVFAQDYEQIQVIIADDGSTDNSQDVIKELLEGKTLQCIFNEENIGYTRTFNSALKHAEGEFIIDYALDDVMKPAFVRKSVDRFKLTDRSTGVVFSNADYIDEDSNVIGNHNESLFKKKMIKAIPEGDIFTNLMDRYFICTPTMVIRKEVFDRLGGYDEALAYEDFDFWIRSSRYWEYAYTDVIEMQKRKLKSSMSAARYQFTMNKQLKSTRIVCEKAFHLCKTEKELKLLGARLNYEYRQCIRNGANDLAEDYQLLIKKTGSSLDAISLGVRFLGRKFHRKHH